MHTNQIQALFRIMSERARLVEMINFNESCARDLKLQAVQDLLSLCNKDFKVMYCSEEESFDRKCSVCYCLLSKTTHFRFDHIHACRRREITKNIARQSNAFISKNVQYCYFCFTWFEDAVI